MFCKNFLLYNDVLRHLVLLFHSKRVYLRVAALRVFRQCLGTNDEFYRRLLIKKDVFGPIVKLLLGTNGKNNLLNSACLEFFEFIKKVLHLSCEPWWESY